MKKGLIALACLAVVAIATGVSAASSSYSSVTTKVSGGINATASLNTVTSGSNSPSQININGQHMPSDTTTTYSILAQ